MAQIQESGGQEHKGGKKRAKRGIPSVDMTPMVDLGFLLLTFFVMTSTFSKPKIMNLAYPAKTDITDKNPPLEISNAITFLLSENKIFYYEGKFKLPDNKDGLPPTELTETSFGPEGIRKLLTDKNTFVSKEKNKLDQQLRNKEIADTTYNNLLKSVKSSGKALKVLVKTDELAKCRNFIDVIDELRIADIGAFQPADITGSELDLLKEKLK
jgi:biopolymer transport protein ExbD